MTSAAENLASGKSIEGTGGSFGFGYTSTEVLVESAGVGAVRRQRQEVGTLMGRQRQLAPGAGEALQLVRWHPPPSVQW